MVQFIGQAIGVLLLRKKKGVTSLPYKMPLYPLPVIFATFLWLFIFYATGMQVITMFLIVAGSGVVVYLLRNMFQQKQPTI
jgi:amino acid transporter